MQSIPQLILAKISFYYTEYDEQKNLIIKMGKALLHKPIFINLERGLLLCCRFYEARNRVHTFRIDRIARQPEILSEDAYPMPADFDTSEYALGVFQMFDTYKSEKSR